MCATYSRGVKISLSSEDIEWRLGQLSEDLAEQDESMSLYSALVPGSAASGVTRPHEGVRRDCGPTRKA